MWSSALIAAAVKKGHRIMVPAICVNRVEHRRRRDVDTFSYGCVDVSVIDVASK